jgi:hypothetical protein
MNSLTVPECFQQISLAVDFFTPLLIVTFLVSLFLGVLLGKYLEARHQDMWANSELLKSDDCSTCGRSL